MVILIIKCERNFSIPTKTTEFPLHNGLDLLETRESPSHMLMRTAHVSEIHETLNSLETPESPSRTLVRTTHIWEIHALSRQQYSEFA